MPSRTLKLMIPTPPLPFLVEFNRKQGHSKLTFPGEGKSKIAAPMEREMVSRDCRSETLLLHPPPWHSVTLRETPPHPPKRHLSCIHSTFQINVVPSIPGRKVTGPFGVGTSWVSRERCRKASCHGTAGSRTHYTTYQTIQNDVKISLENPCGLVLAALPGYCYSSIAITRACFCTILLLWKNNNKNKCRFTSGFL